jgi:FAD/FMN-containing dehydrogenase
MKSLDELRGAVRAKVVVDGDPDYADLRLVHNGMIDCRPSVIVRAEQLADVHAVIAYAVDNELDLSIRGGGHSAPGFGTNNGGVVLDLSGLRAIDIDPTRQTARVGGGATWGEFNNAGYEFGLATTGGIISTTGVGGLTLGGGIGYLSRKCGLTIDNLLSAEVALADGTTVTASAESHPDLFWALRGGGGNFGVVTTFEFQLHPVKDVYVGMFFYEVDAAGDLLRFFRDFIPTADESYGAFPIFQIAPPLPFIPEDRHGDVLCAAIVVWAGDLNRGEQAMTPFRDIAPVVAELMTPMPYPAMNASFDALYPKGLRSYWKGNFVTTLSDELIDAHLRHGPHVPTVSSTMHLYPVNGACHRVGADDTAFAYRDATFSTVILSSWQDPADDHDNIQWVRDYAAATAKYSEPGGYINFMGADDGDRMTENYRGHVDRLRTIKRTYDPGNVFHVNQNIPPSAA